MSEQLTDEQILEIDDAPSSDPSTAESVESTTESTGQYGDGSEQQAETTTDTGSQGKEQQVAREQREPATYEDLGTPDELRELVDADQQIFSADQADNDTWIEKFSTEHRDVFNRIFDRSIAYVQKTNPAKWEQVGKNAVKGLFERDHLWDALEAAYAANSGNPALREFLQNLAAYVNSFGVGPAPQNAHPGFDQPTQTAINADLEQFFEKHIDESLPQLRDLPAHSRALVLRQIHGQIDGEIRKDQNHQAALKRALLSGAPDALDRAIEMIARRGLTVLPSIAERWGKTIPPALRQSDIKTMSDRDVLDSNRPGSSRPVRTQGPAGKLTRDAARTMTDREIIDDVRPVEVGR